MLPIAIVCAVGAVSCHLGLCLWWSRGVMRTRKLRDNRINGRPLSAFADPSHPARQYSGTKYAHPAAGKSPGLPQLPI